MIIFQRLPHFPNPWSRILPIIRHIMPVIFVVGMLPILTLTSSYANAQVLDRVFIEEADIKSLPLNSLRLEVDASAFFHDNEYDSKIQDGYTLPGGRLTPHLSYNPIKQINIEAGASMLFYNGTNRYPNFAYHDIATWKGSQYQHGVHALPWLRLQASLENVDVVVGSIYGGANHRLIAPLYNPEQHLSTDPEMGVQILVHRPRFQLDTWVNWQSYIFKYDDHQEAFTVGTTARIQWGRRKPSHFLSVITGKSVLRFFTPIQLLIQHRGGEQDVTNMGVQTLCNASAGLGVEWTPSPRPSFRKKNHNWTRTSPLNSFIFQSNVLGSYQQAGKLWPYETGFAAHAGLSTEWMEHLTVDADYLYAPKQFASLFGNPFFSTFSMLDGGTQVNADGTLSGQYQQLYNKSHTLRIGLGYHHTFAKAYTLGASAELFNINARECHNENTVQSNGTNGKLKEFNFSFGIYLRVSPSFILKKF